MLWLTQIHNNSWIESPASFAMMREPRWTTNSALRCIWTFWGAAKVSPKMERDRMKAIRMKKIPMKTIRIKTIEPRKQRETMVAQ
jgi:hypothetical protein